MATAVLVLLLAAAGLASGQDLPVSFNHGVASGDPLSNSIILWTRVTPREVNATKLAALALPVTWYVSTNAAFSRPAATGTFVTTADRDFTVKVEAGGLRPGTTYYFMFSVGAIKSSVGRFRLPAAPGARQNALQYAIFSCSNWGWGYFNAYDAAARYDLDFWVHVGDFIYEYSVNEYPSPSQAVRFQEPPLGLQPATELYSLSDYRKRHALYRQDPGLQALSANSPVIAAWDDHETANDSYEDGAENHNPGEGSWADRKAAAVRAYHEWMPTRVGLDPESIYRSFQFGDLATLLMMETRLTARTAPPPGGNLGDAFTALAYMGFASYPPSVWTQGMETAARAFAAQGDAVRQNASRTILGPVQLQWIRDTTRASLAAGTKWQLYGQDTVMLDTWAPSFEKAIASAPPAKRGLWAAAVDSLTGAGNGTTSIYTKTARWSYLRGMTIPVTAAMKAGARLITALAKYKVNWTYDSWMGYQAEKARFLQAVTGGAADAQKTGSLNAVIYGGDSHNAWAGVESVNGTVVATEFDGPGVTSPGFEDYFPYIPTDLMAAGMVANNPGMVYSNMEDKGFMLVTLTHATHRLEMMKVSTIASMDYDLKCDAAFEVAAGSKALRNAGCSQPRQGTPYSSALQLTVGLGRQSSALP